MNKLSDFVALAERLAKVALPLAHIILSTSVLIMMYYLVKS